MTDTAIPTTNLFAPSSALPGISPADAALLREQIIGGWDALQSAYTQIRSLIARGVHDRVGIDRRLRDTKTPARLDKDTEALVAYYLGAMDSDDPTSKVAPTTTITLGDIVEIGGPLPFVNAADVELFRKFCRLGRHMFGSEETRTRIFALHVFRTVLSRQKGDVYPSDSNTFEIPILEGLSEESIDAVKSVYESLGWTVELRINVVFMLTA